MTTVRQWTGVHRPQFVSLAEQGRHSVKPDLSWQPMGKWIQRTLQRNASSRGAQWRMVFNDQTGPGSNKFLAETEQSHPSTPGLECKAAGARNSFTGWYITRGLDRTLFLGREPPPVISSLVNCRGGKLWSLVR